MHVTTRDWPVISFIKKLKAVGSRIFLFNTLDLEQRFFLPIPRVSVCMQLQFVLNRYTQHGGGGGALGFSRSLFFRNAFPKPILPRWH